MGRAPGPTVRVNVHILLTMTQVARAVGGVTIAILHPRSRSDDRPESAGSPGSSKAPAIWACREVAAERWRSKDSLGSVLRSLAAASSETACSRSATRASGPILIDYKHGDAQFAPARLHELILRDAGRCTIEGVSCLNPLRQRNPCARTVSDSSLMSYGRGRVSLPAFFKGSSSLRSSFAGWGKNIMVSG